MRKPCVGIGTKKIILKIYTIIAIRKGLSRHFGRLGKRSPLGVQLI